MNPRRVVGGWLALIVLYTVVTNADRVDGVLGLTTRITRRLADPTLALIPAAQTQAQQQPAPAPAPAPPTPIAPGTVLHGVPKHQ